MGDIVQLDEGEIRNQLGEMVRKSRGYRRSYAGLLLNVRKMPDIILADYQARYDAGN